MNNRLPSLSGLRAFEAAARHLSVTLAAGELNVTPGAVSRQIRHLESDLGRPLLRRHRLHDVPRPDIDLRIRYGDGVWPGEQAMKIQDDRVVAVASPAFLARHPIGSPADLADAPLLSVEGADWVWMTWASFLREAGTPFGRLNVRRFNSYVIALQAARDGQGVALGWLSLVGPLIDAGELVQVTDAEVADPSAFYVTWSERRHLSPEAVLFRDWLLAQGR